MNAFENLDESINKKLFQENITINDDLIAQEKLFECNSEIKNHFYFENQTDECFFDLSGPKKDFELFYKQIIKSGIGTVILGGTNLLKVGKQTSNARISLDENIMSVYKQIVLFAHSSKAKIYLKINAGLGRFFTKNNNQKTIKYGSNFCLDPENRQNLVFRISDNKCNELINEIAKTVLLSNVSCLDGVVIDASFSNLIGELSSLEFNKRVFGYFSNIDDFIVKLLKSIDAKNNKLILKFSVLSLFDDEKYFVDFCKIKPSININKIIETLEKYIRLGIDGFEFVFGRWENDFLNKFNGFIDGYLFEDFIKQFREHLNKFCLKNKFGKDIEIFYHDNFNNFSKANEMVKNNIVNFIDITKNIYSDLDFLNQTKNAKLVKKCLNCSYCNKISREKQKVECLINPRLTDFEELKPSFIKTEVAVIGSGISGLTCALILAKRGYIVQIFEKSNYINPCGKISTIFSFDKTLLNYYETIEKELNEFIKNKKIILNLNNKFTVESSDYKKFYSIIVATGFKSDFLPVSGAVQPHVVNIFESLKCEELLLSKNKIVIYAKSILSLKLALFLTQKNKNVTIVIKDIELFNLEKNANLFYFVYILYKFNVKIHFLARITQINEDNIDVLISKNIKSNSLKTMLKIFSNDKLNLEKQLINIDCDCLIYEPTTKPNNNLYIDLVKNGYKGELYLIGNALENGSLADHIKSGYFVGKNL